MTKREKVLKATNCHTKADCFNCPYFEPVRLGCVNDLIKDATEVIVEAEMKQDA